MFRVINPFLFASGGGFSPAVNGKMPVAAWIPSRDGAGNGTTTLTDLVGSNNGTLTNMDAATDWVADTDAGGVRALDFDGVNDRVNAPVSLSLTSDFSMSCWIKLASLSQSGAFFKVGGGENAGVGVGVGTTFTTDNNNLTSLREGIEWHHTAVAFGSLWFHCVYTYTHASITHNVYLDSVFRQTFAGFLNGGSAAEIDLGGYERTGFLRYANLRGDDWRLFDSVLNTTDIADLYASGLGRGIDVS